MRLAADAQKKPVKTVVKQAEPEKTKEEIYRQRAQEAEKERVARERYGPKKIIVTRNSQGTTDGATPKKAGKSGGLNRGGRDSRHLRKYTGQKTAMLAEQPADRSRGW